MASRKHIWAFIIVFLLPLVPVILLYFFFEDQNYFELKDKAKGLVALGPIGVYIFLLYPAWKIFVGTIDKSKEGRIKDIIGKWRIISKSKKGTTYEGEVTISASEDHVLDIAGVVRHDTDVVATISTIFAKLIKNELHIVYRMTDQRYDNQEFRGYSSLSIDFEKMVMNGYWSLVGDENHGTVTYDRYKSG